jgi:glycerate 2-kinase
MPGVDPREAALRSDAIALAAAAIAASDAGRMVAAHLRCYRDGAEIAGARYEVAPGGVCIVAVGKAAIGMAHAAVRTLAPLDPRGVAVAPPGGGEGPTCLETIIGEHPAPGPGSIAAARRVEELLAQAGSGDLVLFLVSGGASSLLGDLPEGIDPRAYSRAVSLLLRAGAAIDELNAVRRGLATLKGGRAVLLARPARVAALLVSDVVGSDPAVIGSGPTVGWGHDEPRPLSVVRKCGVFDDLPASVREALRSPEAFGIPPPPRREDPRLASVHSRVVGDNDTAVRGVAAWARRLGYTVRRLRRPVTGEARKAGARLGRLARRSSTRAAPASKLCLVGGGETIVRVTGPGRGGRNQELVAAAALELDGIEAVCLCSLGTDGVDGPTPAAGALAAGSSVSRASEIGLSVEAALRDNDTFHLFDRLDDLVVTGPTGTNVMDVQILLLGER